MPKLVKNSALVQTLLDAPTSSFWLKRALCLAMQRDPVDAAHDARLLADTLEERADALLEAAQNSVHPPPTQYHWLADARPAPSPD